MLHSHQIKTIKHVEDPGQLVSNYIQRALAVHNHYGQLVHTFQPPSLSSTQIRLHPNIHPWLMVSINCYGHTINVTMPFNTRLINRQQFFFSPAIVAFCWSVLATMVSKRMQTIVILLQQYSPDHITMCIRVNHKRIFKVRQVQNWCEEPN